MDVAAILNSPVKVFHLGELFDITHADVIMWALPCILLFTFIVWAERADKNGFYKSAHPYRVKKAVVSAYVFIAPAILIYTALSPFLPGPVVVVLAGLLVSSCEDRISKPARNILYPPPLWITSKRIPSRG